MKKKLLTLGALTVIMSVYAQVPTTFVANNAKVYVKQKALVYNGGGLKTSGTESLLENEGNIMLVGGANDKIETVEPHAEGRNIILKLNNKNAPYNNYGQLYVQGFNQDNITAVVRKEYKSNKHGAYQQMAVPFHGKKLDFKHNNTNELGKDISEHRWTNDEVVSWSNKDIRFDSMPLTATSVSEGDNREGGRYKNKATSYYLVGATGGGTNGSKVLFDASVKVYDVHGIPFASGHKEILKDAGKDKEYGDNSDTITWDYEKGGNVENIYREKYNTYLLDAWENPWQTRSLASNEGFGRNLYLFGNPYLMNLDLSVFAHMTKANENLIENLHGIRLAFVDDNSDWNEEKGGAISRHRETPTTPGYIGFSKRNDGYYTLIGDVASAIVKPMGTFVIKLKNNTSTSAQELDFDKLRTFAHTARYSNSMPENSLRPLSKSSNSLAGRSTLRKATMGSESVKQLGVFALDKDGNVLDRTYYVVANDFVTGFSDEKNVQVYAGDVNAIGTFEESVDGGIDNEHTNRFLYINEANETEFKGKAIPLALYDNRIVALKFEVRENALTVGDNGRTQSGDSFYIGAYGNTNDAKAIAQKQEIPTNGATFFSLYFGKPVNSTLSVDAVPNKPSSTFLIKDSSDGQYKLFFDKNWKKAEVSVYDASGKLLKTYNEINTQNSLVVELPNVNAAYVVKAVSEKGETYVQKVRK